MTGAADATRLPDAGTKLRMVLDYVPCEACLAHPVEEQDLLCSVCARLDRQVAVRVGVRKTILVERPSPPPAPIVIPPAVPEPERAPVAPPRPVLVRFPHEAAAAVGDLEVLVEPLLESSLPLLTPAPRAEPIVAAPVAPPPEPAPAPAPPAEPEFDVDDLVSVTPARDEFFDYRKAPTPAPAARPPPPPPPPPPRAAPEPVVEDDFVFRPPAPEEAPPAPPVEEPVLADDVVPTEEVPVEPPAEETARWAPPPDFLAEEAASELEEEVYPADAVPPEEEPAEEIAETEVLLEPEPEEILEAEVVADEEPVVEAEVVETEVVEAEVVETEEAPPSPLATGTGDLYRLRGFDAADESALARAGITQVAHLAGRDPADLAGRTGLRADRLVAWVHVADLVNDVGVPLDAANALVAAGIQGPQGLAEADADEVEDRVAAFGGAMVSARDVRRWKRRA